ncbi:hypothetical protein GCK72_023045 [Caenorhabditis remanei]|uniref:Uncharacterized protein n=1 Tax=Caenorhabditis remanei TaxID=31234 RepID=A0A6A5FVE8_CAERE|nr:hypothetical protein GCK72_023045 [Caenorhabditis remanei]KAF1746588.1 hypothetical protein GCK72_023045 [Caenorhabditis remanei]
MFQWTTAKKTFNKCTRGYEAKVINVVGYSILQIVLDLTVFQMMLRYMVSEWRGETASLDMNQEIEPTPERVKTLAFFFFLTLIGSIVAVYQHPIGTMMLIFTQVCATIATIYHLTVPFMRISIEELWDAKNNYAYNGDYYTAIYHSFTTFCHCIVYIFPTFFNIWIIYCTFVVMLVFFGYKIFDIKKETETTESVISDSTTSEVSTPIPLPVQFAPAKTYYYSDTSSTSD